MEYRPTNYPYYHPKKQGQIVLNPPQPSLDKEGVVIGMIAQLHPTILESLKIDPTAQVVVAELALETLDTLITEQ